MSEVVDERGLTGKFIVARSDGNGSQEGDKHHGCDYFVLDLTHDPHAAAAIVAYAASCEVTHPQLSKDLMEKIHAIADELDDHQEVMEE